MEVVINAQYGGFSISEECAKYMAERGSEQAQAELDEYMRPLDPEREEDQLSITHGWSKHWYGYGYSMGKNGYERTDPHLIEAVKALGEKANGCCATLKIVEVPDGADWYIDEYDGFEHVAEKHRTWS